MEGVPRPFNDPSPTSGLSQSTRISRLPVPYDPTPEELLELEIAALTGLNVVPDPRPKEVIEAEKEVNKKDKSELIEKRPRCAGYYAEFLVQREATVKAWGAENVPKSPQLRQPIDHSANEVIYDKGVLASSKADPKIDCPPCQKNCPLKEGISPENAYATMHKEVKTATGNKVRPSETAIFLGRGGSRSNVLKDTLETFDGRGERMIEKYPHDYLPKIA